MNPNPKSLKVPKNWPDNVTYITTPSYCPTLEPRHLTSICTRQHDSKDIPLLSGNAPSPLVKIVPILTPSHPAHGQYGLFAAKDLPAGTFIVQYVGQLHASLSLDSPTTKPDPHADSDYDLSLDRDLRIGIDADKMGNEARFINDYRGVAERPNAEFKEIWDEKRKERGIGVWVLPLGKSGKGKGIKKGEEILVSYGRGFWDARKGDTANSA